jgi:hypothetical protein
VPIGQAVQVDAPAKEYVPGGQREHEDEPGEDHVPAAQRVQTRFEPDTPD